MPFDMQTFRNGQYPVLPVHPETKYTKALLQQAKFNRHNFNVNAINYSFPKNGVNYNRIISKSGMIEQRMLTLLPPRRLDNFADIAHYAGEQNAKLAVIHDGLQFVVKHRPYLTEGEIVIGFPGMVRQNCSTSYFPIIGISSTEIFLDEVPTNIGWEDHWWVGIAPDLNNPHFWPKPIYYMNGIH